jgi:two-component system nitrogen regulation response regulator GlnG
MAPSQLIEPKDLPPEVEVSGPEGLASAPSLQSSSEATGLDAPGTGATATANAAASTPNEASPVWRGPVGGVSPGVLPGGLDSWEIGLEADAIAMLASGRPDVWDALTRRFESRLIQAALGATRGRRIEAAVKLGIGRNTITRKIQELGLE